MSDLNRLRGQNPAQAVAEAQTYLKTDLLGGQRDAVYVFIIDTQSQTLKNPQAALTTLDQVLPHIEENREFSLLLHRKILLVRAAGRLPEAERLFRDNWERIVSAGFWVRWMPEAIETMQAQGKKAEALDWTREQITQRVGTLERRPELFLLLAKQLTEAGKQDEALGWAKLFWIFCPYDDVSLRNAALLAVQADPKPVENGAAIVAALQNPTLPNPLTSAKLPELPLETLRASATSASAASERLSYDLLIGDLQRAFLEAKRTAIDNPGSEEGILAMCRVFKARDLNLKRANEFLEWSRTGQGHNPLEELQKELSIEP